MTDWYQKSINTLPLNGKAEHTQEAYTRAVRMLSAFYGKSPDEITEPELEAYFLLLPRGFMKVRYYGFLSPSSSVPLEDVKARIELAPGFAGPTPETTLEAAATLPCRHCGGVLRFCRLVLPGDPASGWLGSLGEPVGGSAVLSAVSAGP
jgi:hypothetical protein